MVQRNNTHLKGNVDIVSYLYARATIKINLSIKNTIVAYRNHRTPMISRKELSHTHVRFFAKFDAEEFCVVVSTNKLERHMRDDVVSNVIL